VIEPAFRIRPARPEDAGALGELSHRAATVDAPAWMTVHSIEEETAFIGSLIDQADPRRLILVAVDGQDRVLGGAGVTRSNDGEPRAHLNSIGVMPGAEGRGIARALLAAIEAWCREQGLDELTLDVYPSNQRARRLYEGVGFETQWHRLRKRIES
jgi:ribosomal protein S18 acetylase RimI-like enzyme